MNNYKKHRTTNTASLINEYSFPPSSNISEQDGVMLSQQEYQNKGHKKAFNLSVTTDHWNLSSFIAVN